MKKVSKKFEAKLKYVLEVAQRYNIDVIYRGDFLSIMHPKGGSIGVYVGDGTKKSPISVTQSIRNMEIIFASLNAIDFWRGENK